MIERLKLRIIGRNLSTTRLGSNSLIFFILNTNAYLFSTLIVMMIFMIFLNHLYSLCYVIYVWYVFIICMFFFVSLFSEHWEWDSNLHQAIVRKITSKKVWSIHRIFYLWFHGKLGNYFMYSFVLFKTWFPSLWRYVSS